MIVDWFIGIAGGIVGWFFDGFPADPEAQIVFTVNDMISPWVVGMGQLGVWIPWAAVLGASLVVGTLYAAAFLVRIGRAVLGHIPFVGGNG